MQYNVPLVSSNSSCLPENYDDATLYFDPRDATDLAGKFTAVLSDKSLRKDLIRKGRKQLKKFSWEQMAEETHKVYRESL